MRRDARAYLWEAIQAADAVLRYTEGKALDDVLGETLLSDAVERQLIALGEALSQLSQAFPQIAKDFPGLPKVVAFRNILLQGYSDLDWQAVWTLVQQPLPMLKAAMQARLEVLG